MTMLKPKKKEKTEVKGKMKKSLILGLAAGLMMALTTNAMAVTYPDPAVAGAKDTAFAATTIQDTSDEAAASAVNNVADPAPHGDQFYLPGDPSDGTTKIHSNYTKNTDACAACHFTHTAEGPRLLQWNSIYKTCSACHDGSLGNYTYDVYNGKIGTTATRTYGGLFGANPTTMESANEGGAAAAASLSNHMPNGYMALNAAPGNTLNDNYFNGVAFDCASCHTPHGQGGNARILSPDPGKAAISQFFTDDTTTDKNVAIDNFDAVLTSTDGKVWSDTAKNWIQGYPYNKITAIFQVPAADVANFNPSFTVAGGVTANVGTKLTSGYTIDWRNGKVTLDAATSDKIIAIRVPGIFVAMKITDYMKSTEKVDYIAKNVDQNGVDGASDAKEGINAYCGACHGDYNTQGNVASKNYDFVTAGDKNHGSGQVATGVESQKYRHQFGFKWVGQWTGQANYIKFANPIAADGTLVTNTKVFTCLGCHFAHGTDEQLWSDTTSGQVTGSETYGSSALKRLPNMGTCENCHDKASGNNKDQISTGTYY